MLLSFQIGIIITFQVNEFTEYFLSMKAIAPRVSRGLRLYCYWIALVIAEFERLVVV